MTVTTNTAWYGVVWAVGLITGAIFREPFRDALLEIVCLNPCHPFLGDDNQSAASSIKLEKSS